MNQQLNKILAKQKNENQYRTQIIRAINKSRTGYCWTNDPSFYSNFGISDIVGTDKEGKLFAIELKLWKGTSYDPRNQLLHNGQVTPNQHNFLTILKDFNCWSYVGVIFREKDIMCLINHRFFFELGVEKLTLGWAKRYNFWVKIKSMELGISYSYNDIT